MIAVLALGGDFSQSAFARHHKPHPQKTQKYHYKADKNAYLFGGKYKAPKKQHYAKGSFHNTGTGVTVPYGKK
jgi:hypothetical protein